MPSIAAHRPEVTTSIVRELHVTGKTVGVGIKEGQIQHAGIHYVRQSL